MAYTNYRLHDFLNGTAKLGTLVNLVAVFRRSRTSQLARAIAMDEDLARSMLRRKPSTKEEPPDLAEFTLEASFMASMLELLQQIAHHTAGASWSKKKPRVHKILRPVTAFMRLRKKRSREAYEDLLKSFNFIPDDEFQRQAAEAAAPSVRREVN